MSRRSIALILCAIFVLALALRLWAIDFGLPYALHIDEHSYVVGSLNLGQGEITGYPQQTGLVNTLFGEYAAYYLIGRVLKLFQSTQAFSDTYHLDPTNFYLIGRLTIALMGALSVLAVYQLGRQIQSRAAGIIAALLVAVNVLHVRESHFLTPDVPQSLGFLLIVLLCLSALKTQRRKWLYLAAILGGIVIAWKWASLPLMLPLWFTAWQMDKSAPRGNKMKLLIVSSIVALVGFAIFSPELFMYPDRYIQWAQMDYVSGSVGGYGGFVIDNLPGWMFYLRAVLIGMGIIGAAFSLIGIGVLLARWVKTREQDLILIGLLCAAYFLQMAISQRFFVRYAMPLFPFLAISAGVAVDWICARWLARRRVLATAAYVALTLALILQPLAADVRVNLIWGQTDTRVVAKQWIEAHLPEGSRIATDWQIHGVPLATPKVPQPYSTRTYTVTEINGLGLSEHPVEYYRDGPYDYLITTSYISALELVDRAQDVQRKAFYQSLNQKFKLVQDFLPYTGNVEPPFFFDEIYGPLISMWNVDRPGPTLRIYQVKKE
jgi:hypothetical protein